MTTAAEAAAAKTALASDLAEGVKNLSLDQKVRFELYVRVALPIDGFVFWVRSELISDQALAALVNTQIIAGAQKLRSTIEAIGSLHYATSMEQIEESTVGVNSVIFTSLQPVQDLSAVGPNTIYIATFGLLPPRAVLRAGKPLPLHRQRDLLDHGNPDHRFNR